MNEEQQVQEVRPNGPEPKPEPVVLLEPLRSVVRYSETMGMLIGALAKAQLEYKPILKDVTNPYYNSKYADLSNVIEATRPALAKNGLVIIQHSTIDMDHQRLTLTSRLAHSSGEWTENELTLPANMAGKDGRQRFDAQSCGAAMTYARRYAYQGLAGVAAELDDDGNAAAGVGSRQTAQQVAQAKIADLEKKLAPPSTELQPETNGEPPMLFSLQIWPDIFEISGHSDVMEAHKNLLLLYGKKVVTGRGEARKATVHMDGEKLANFTFEFEKRGGKVKALKPAETNANS